MKKILAALLLAILVLSAVPCLAESVPTIRITIVMNPLVTDYEDNYFTKWIEEAYGCKLEFTFLPTGEDAKTKLNVMIAGGEDLGDVLMIEGLDKATIQNYADAGAFYDLTPYFESQDTNLEKLSEEIGEDLVAAIKTATGEIWAYPDYYPETNNMTKYRAWINQTWLDNLGLEMPTTPEELYTVLKAFKEQDANGNGDPDDEIPMLGAPSWSADPCVYLTNAFVYWDDVEDLIITDGKIDAAYVQEGYKEALTYMNRLVSEGLLAPETFTITEGQYREYLSTETPTVGVCFYTHLGFVGPTDENKNQYQYMPYLIGADGKQRVSYQPYDISVMSHCYIPTSAKDPDLSFDFINWLFSEETYVRARFGVEGVHYDKVDDPETLELLKSNHAVRKGGIIILIGSCREELGEKVFEEWMLSAPDPQSMIERIGREFQLGGHKAAAIAMTLQHAQIMLVSELEDDFVRRIFLEPVHSAQEALDEALRRLGGEAKIIAMPYGGSTLPRAPGDG